MGYIYHKVVAADLEPGTMYAYRVGDKAAGKWSDLGTFKTDDGDDKFSFIAIADVQASSEKNFQFASKVLEAGYRTLPEAEFFMSAGDFVNDCCESGSGCSSHLKRFMNTAAVPIAGGGNLKWHWFENQFSIRARAATASRAFTIPSTTATLTLRFSTPTTYPMSEQQLAGSRTTSTSPTQWRL